MRDFARAVIPRFLEQDAGDQVRIAQPRAQPLVQSQEFSWDGSDDCRKGAAGAGIEDLQELFRRPGRGRVRSKVIEDEQLHLAYPLEKPCVPCGRGHGAAQEVEQVGSAGKEDLGAAFQTLVREGCRQVCLSTSAGSQEQEPPAGMQRVFGTHTEGFLNPLEAGIERAEGTVA